MTAKAPALIYHDLNLVERVLRDQVSDNFSTIWVDSETEYERVVRFLNRFQPSLVRRVKLYTKETPLFEQFGIQDEITKALRSEGLAQVRWIDCYQPDGSAGCHRHQYRQVCRQDGASRRHDSEDEPRRDSGDCSADSSARSGRHHRDRLHRHG